ncbi:MAG: hypothetical protein AMXMBFR4_31240 [Candidatus Hydrogenedentota bacterium]
MDDNLGIAAGLKDVTARLQFRAQPFEIVNLAVAHEGDVVGFREERLAAPGEIDDRESRVAETDAALRIEVGAGAVGSAVPEGAHGPFDIRQVEIMS